MPKINVLVDKDKSIMCFFRKKKFTLNIISENGTAIGAGEYDANTEVNLEAIPNSGYEFNGWTGDLVSQNNPETIIMNSNKTITANFINIQYSLSVTASPIDGGVVTGAGNYNAGTIVEVEGIPNEHYEFDHWEGDIDNFELGIGLFSPNSSYFDTVVDKFDYIRIDIPDYQNIDSVNYSKSQVINLVGKGARVIWGVSSNNGNSPNYVITASNWPDFRQAILDSALWANNNGVFEFQLGNEEEWHVDGTTMTAEQLINNIKILATEVKAIFTNGEISYSCFPTYCQNWANVGKGDIDYICSNLYMGGNGDYSDYWKGLLNILVTAFGVDGTYLTEFNISWQSLDDYSTSENEQAIATQNMIDYIKSVGIKRALYFCLVSNANGVIKNDGTYRQLIWDILINN